MKNVMAITLMVAMLLALVICPFALAGSCSFRGYSSHGYSSGYKHSGYDHHGYSTHYKGAYWWPGGYYSGGYGYGAGHYAPGWYDQYGKGYSGSCGYNYPVAAYFPKYESAFIILQTPSYGIYAEQKLPEAPAGYAGAASGYGAGATASADSGKLDRILVLTEQTSGRLAKVESRLDVLEGKRTPPPDAPAAPKPGAPPPAATPADGPSILHARCASCHDAKVVAKLRAKVTLFGDGPSGPEMANVNAKGELEPLSPATLKKVEAVLADSSMPPERDAAGKPVPAMPAQERKDALDFVRKALAGR